jgi:hypothetical protein
MIVIPNRVRVVAVMSALALAGGLFTLALQAKPTEAQAQTETTQESIPLRGGLANNCTGEDLFIEGTLHTTYTVTQDAAGATHLQYHGNFVATGVGYESGDEYIFREANNYHVHSFDLEPDQAPYTLTQPYRFLALRKGSNTRGDNFVFSFLQHITITANGEVTSDVSEERIECY